MKEQTTSAQPELPAKFGGIEIEKVQPIVIDDGLAALGARLATMYRAPFGGDNGRFYFREAFDDFYAGYSLWTKKVLPTNPMLIQWMVDKGEEGKLISLTAREYGSLFHLIVARHERTDDEFLFRFNSPASDEWESLIDETVMHFGLPISYREKWRRDMRNDMFAYFKWKEEHKVKVLAVETPVWDDDWRIATPCDMVVSCLVKASPYAKEPTVPCIAGVDFKSGDNGGDYDEYDYQLAFIRHAWNKRFADSPYEMTRTLNWSPKSRALSPGNYHFKDKTGNVSEERLKWAGEGCRINGYNKPSGSVITYQDDPEGRDAPTLAKQSPYDWLHSFFAQRL